VGVIDPARLASAIDIQQAALPPTLPSEVAQSRCWSCGGMVDATQESHCRHCHAILQKIDSQRAVAATVTVEEKVRQNYQQQLPSVSSRKIQDVAAQHLLMSSVGNHWDHRQTVTREQVLRWLIVLVPTVLLLVWLLVQWQRREPTTPTPAPHAAPVTAPVVITPPTPPGSAISPAVALRAPETQVLVGPSVESMFSFPAMVCDGNAKARSAVKIRQIVMLPTASDSPGVNGVDNRKAYLALQRARQELVNGTPFPVVAQQFGSPGAINEQQTGEVFARGSGNPAVERAAFCLPVGALSPIFKSAAGFHLIQVLEAR
jgi:hypothetical protein